MTAPDGLLKQLTTVLLSGAIRRRRGAEATSRWRPGDSGDRRCETQQDSAGVH
jgi:hypothetical protein